MFTFDTKGLLKPYEPITCSVEDLKSRFVDEIDSKTRQSNFDKYVKYSDDLKDLVGGEGITQWVNGSFVTKKVNPKDIDIITFLDHSIIEQLGGELAPFTPSLSWQTYEVDAYILEVYPEGHKQNKFTKSDRAYWYDLFGQTRPNRNGVKSKKGFLEIIY